MVVDPESRILDLPAAIAWRRAVSGRVVFTNGVFDLLHRGHVDLLRAARLRGDALVVAINSDASVRRLKGPSRPLRTAADRAYVIAALAMVDVVLVFDDDTPERIIECLTPDVLVKGGDYAEATVVGATGTRARGGEVVIVPLTAGHSTTNTVSRLRDAKGAD